MNQTPDATTARYGTVIHEHNHPLRLRAAVRTGGIVDLHPLTTVAPHYEDARVEAQTKFPDVPFFVPRLGEMPS